MTVTVLLFGPQALRAGRRQIEVPIDEGATVGTLRSALAVVVPEIQASLPGSRFAVNQEFVDDAKVLTTEDEIALIGMLGGG